MAISTTTVTGTVYTIDGFVAANQYVRFTPLQVGADNDDTPSGTFLATTVEGKTDASGLLKASDGVSDLVLWVNGESDIQCVYRVAYPDRKIYEVVIPVSAAGGTIDVSELVINHQVAGSSTQQSSALADAQAYTDTAMANPSDNTSFDAPTWRTDLNVEDGSTADQTDVEIKTAYENNADTNAFTDAEKTKLTGIETGATADQTGAEIKTAYESNADTNAFTDSEKTKLGDINQELDTDANVQFNSIGLQVGATVDTIEATITDDDTHIPTSGGVVNFAQPLSAGLTAIDAIVTPTTGDDQGLAIDGQLSVGTPASPREVVVGKGDSYPAGTYNSLVFRCNISNTTGTVITSAADITTEMSSDTLLSSAMFDATSAGEYLLVGSDYEFQGLKAKIAIDGFMAANDVLFEKLTDATPTWSDVKGMATNADFPYSQHANVLAGSGNTSEQWRFGFDPDNLPITWSQVPLTINGVGYTRYWARIRIQNAITTIPILEQLKLHTCRFEVNGTGHTEYFGCARYPRTLSSGVQGLINNNLSSPTNQSVLYESAEVAAGYTDNKFSSTGEVSTLIVQNILSGLDTGIPITLDVSYYVDGTTTGDVQFFLDAFKVSDGFVYDGSAVASVEDSVIDTISVDSNQIRRTVRLKLHVDDATDNDAYLIALRRDATAGNTEDTLAEAVVITNIRLTGYFWRP